MLKQYFIKRLIIIAFASILIQLLLSFKFEFSLGLYYLHIMKLLLVDSFSFLLHRIQIKHRVVILYHLAIVLEIVMLLNIPSLNIPYFNIVKASLFNLGNLLLLISFFRKHKVFHFINSRLLEIALYDPLTQLPNRNFILETCSREVSYCVKGCKTSCKYRRNIISGEKAAILLIDLDDFKIINDYYGHETGDRLLQLFAKRLREAVTEEDYVIRITGDEFLLVINHIHSVTDIHDFIKRLFKSFDDPYIIKHHEIIIHSSIGLSLYPMDGDKIEELMKKADIAMVQSKILGKNQYYQFEPVLELEFNQRFEKINQLMRAIKKREFVLYYQAKTNIDTGKITGLEAFVRWDHPEKGLISPSQFLPMAEELSIISSIDQLVLQLVCQQIQVWKVNRVEPYPISMNISAQFFMNPHFLMIVKSIIKQYNIDVSFLSFEITENIVIKDFERTKFILHKLKLLGIQVHIDNFGQSYSSFNYVKQFPFEYIKIDKSYIKGINQNTIDPAVIQMMMKLSELFDFKVISEGVETKEQLEFLKEIGCHEVQGFHFGRPEPLDKLLSRHKSNPT